MHTLTPATSQSTIEKLRVSFTTHVLPEMLVTDNSTVFTSTEFKTFLSKNDFTSAPYHPTRNGLTQRAVQTFKTAIKKADPSVPPETAVSCFLFTYRLMPHSTTGIPPAELLMGPRPRSHLNRLHPDLTKHVHQKQECQKRAHDRSIKAHGFKTGDSPGA